jgi:ketol-acid reductoisomerase
MREQVARESAGRRLGRQRPGAASAWADVIMVLVPDTVQAALYREAIRPNLTAGNTLMFAHGFNVRFGTLDLPKDIDVSMIAPKSPGHRVRELYQEGAGTPALLAIHQDASGKAKEVALSYAKGIGVTRAGVIETTLPRRRRPICSASKPCCAAASARSSRPHSRRWSKPDTSRRSPTSSACTS